MTLSRFLRDYLYIPLGGNRCGPARQAVNVIADDAAGRIVARRQLDVRRLGRAARHGARGEPRLERTRPPPAARRRLAADAAVRHGVLGAVPRAGFRHRGRHARLDGRDARLGSIALDATVLRALAGGAAVALLGPTSQEAALGGCGRGLARGSGGIAMVYLLLLTGGRLQNVFIYFQF